MGQTESICIDCSSDAEELRRRGSAKVLLRCIRACALDAITHIGVHRCLRATATRLAGLGVPSLPGM